jgi:hypothetical protein
MPWKTAACLVCSAFEAAIAFWLALAGLLHAQMTEHQYFDSRLATIAVRG